MKTDPGYPSKTVLGDYTPTQPEVTPEKVVKHKLILLVTRQESYSARILKLNMLYKW